MGCGTAPGILVCRKTMHHASDGVSEWLWIAVTSISICFVDMFSLEEGFLEKR